MIEFFKGLLSSEKIVDNISSGLDKAILTGEEKKDYLLKFIELSMPMNVARRFIALSVCMLWVFCGVLSMILIVVGSDKLEQLISFGATYIMPPFTVLVSFYFWKRIKLK